jgi:hypothetical protein
MAEMRGPIGGAANEAGAEYRRAVRASLLVCGLTGSAPFSLGLGAHEVPMCVHPEVSALIDDLLAGLEGGRRLWLQATTSLRLRSCLNTSRGRAWVLGVEPFWAT